MKVKIGELANIIDGDRGKNYPKQHDFFEKGYCLFLDTGNVTPEGFSFESTHFISEEKCDALNNGKMKRGDIAYTTRGTVGNAALFNETISYDHVRINSGMVILRAKQDVVYAPFLYQLLKHPDYRKYIKGYCTGSAQPQLPVKNLSQIELDIPELSLQHRIASVLSAYDDLIENNRRQIKLLEEAAQRLYKEWFVDLRFPGHENVKIVDGVPEGWKKVTLKDICSLRKETITPDKIPQGIPYIGLEHMPRKDFCLRDWGNSSDVNSNKFAYYENDILFGKIRPYFHKVGYALNNGVASTDAIIMVANDDMWAMLLLTVSNERFVEYAYKTCKEGAKMPRADWKQMEKYWVLLPDRDNLDKINQYVDAIKKKITVLAFQYRKLSEARDRLLPKLMSGEIEV